MGPNRAGGTLTPVDEDGPLAAGGMDRKVTQLSLVAQDSAKRAGRELQRACTRFGEFVGHAEFAAVVLDPEARILYCNDYLLDITGYARREVIGQGWCDLFVRQPDEDLTARFAALLQDDPRTWNYENAILTATGDRIRVRWNNAVIRSSSGDVIGTTSIGEDFRTAWHDQATAERALRQGTVRGFGPSEIVAITAHLHARPDEASLTFLRMIADQCAQLAEECGESTSGTAVARHIRQMFKV